jgi:hypothetical protein
MAAVAYYCGNEIQVVFSSCLSSATVEAILHIQIMFMMHENHLHDGDPRWRFLSPKPV